MKKQRIVITGGPGSGKTSIVKTIENKGFTCLHEISREVINEARKQGIDQLFLTNPMLFSQKLLDSRLQQFQEALKLNAQTVFYDRGMPDVTAYMDYVNEPYPKAFEKPCYTFKYDVVFLLPPWESIYIQDNERYETFAQAQEIYGFLKKTYQKYGYTMIEVPTGTIEERVDFILTTCLL